MKRILITAALFTILAATPQDTERYVCKVEVQEGVVIKVKVNAPHVDRAIKKALKKALRRGYTPVGDAECRLK